MTWTLGIGHDSVPISVVIYVYGISVLAERTRTMSCSDLLIVCKDMRKSESANKYPVLSGAPGSLLTNEIWMLFGSACGGLRVASASELV